MRIFKKIRKQKATYWKRSTCDKFGKFSYESPVTVDCRWDDRQEEFRTSSGELSLSQAVAFPDRVMYPGDCLKKEPLSTEEDPKDVEGAFEIKAFQQVPNMKNSATFYIAHL